MRRSVLVAALSSWALLLAAGLAWAQRYAARPGEPAAAISRWPGDTRLARHAGTPQLLLFAHPECPCTRAALRELERLVPRLSGADVTVVFSTADGSDPRRSTLWTLASQIAGAALAADPGGREARLFGAATSGQAQLFGSAGEVLFRGGLTPARGHEGAAGGQDAIVELLAGRRAPSTAAVFGCSLFQEP